MACYVELEEGKPRRLAFDTNAELREFLSGVETNGHAATNGNGRAHGSKTKAVLEYIAAHPTATPSQVATALAEFGVKPSTVSNVKTKLRLAKGRKRAAK